jgi:hypothetical protein
VKWGCYDDFAGWSSLVARWAHNPKVGGSNPPPATNPLNHFQSIEQFTLRKQRFGTPAPYFWGSFI